MKKIFYTVLFALVTVSLNAQLTNCGDLFISEYVEGSFNNKALEIYNPTNQPISLANYRLVRWSNGESDITLLEAANEVLPLPAGDNVAAKDVYVVVVNTTDVGTDTIPFAELAAKADAMLCTSCNPTSGSIRTMCFNGDDAISLQKNVGGNWVNIDVFGIIGERPTNGNGNTSPTGGWTNIPPYNKRDANGTISAGAYFLYYWTVDQTLVRKSTILHGDDTARVANLTPGQWNVAEQWDSLPENTFSQLGTHVCDCNTVGVNENTSNSVAATIYPNPATSVLNVRLSESIKTIEIFNVAGQLVYTLTPAEKVYTTKLETTGFSAGLYLVRVQSTNGHIATKKVTIQ